MRKNVSEKLKAAIEFEAARARRKEHPSEYPVLPDLPAGRYTDPQYFDAENKYMWRNSWVIAGHTDQLPEQGSFILWKRLGPPIVIVRGKDDQIRAFYNTCRHRGGPVVREDSGTVQSLRCTYHCWNYELDGDLKFVPDEHEFPGLEKENRGLIPVRLDFWGNLIFLNLNENAPSLYDSMSAVIDDMVDCHFERQKFVTSYDIPVACNWKVLQDAFQEVYHVRHIHQKTIGTFLDHRGTVMTLFAGGHSRMVVPRTAPNSRDEPMPGKEPQPEWDFPRTTSPSYNMFPNFTTPSGEFEQVFLIFWPTSINTSVMQVMWLGHPVDCVVNSEGWQSRLKQFNMILDEDVENLPWIQQSMETPAFKSVPLSHAERRIYHHHVQVDRAIGYDNVPEGLALPEVLDDFVEDY